jgi:cell wall-associated NlpC family hydrolase
MPTTPPVDDIIALARECLGTPFRHQGRTCGVWLDCAGILAHVFEGLGLPYNDEKGYPGRPYKGLLEANLSGQPHLMEVPISQLQAGDVVLFRIETAPQHIGIYTDNAQGSGGTVIHAYKQVEKVTEQSFAPWRHQLKRVYRFVE